MTRTNYLIILCWDAASKRKTAVLDKNGNCLSLCGLAGRYKQGARPIQQSKQKKGKRQPVDATSRKQQMGVSLVALRPESLKRPGGAPGRCTICACQRLISSSIEGGAHRRTADGLRCNRNFSASCQPGTVG